MFAKSATLQLQQQFAGPVSPLEAESRILDVLYFYILPHFCLVTAVITSTLSPTLQTSPSPLMNHACDFRWVIYLTDSSGVINLVFTPTRQ